MYTAPVKLIKFPQVKGKNVSLITKNIYTNYTENPSNFDLINFILFLPLFYFSADIFVRKHLQSSLKGFNSVLSSTAKKVRFFL